MTDTATLHGEWLSLIDVSGPFLAEPVLKDAFPQGLEDVDASKRRTLRQAYDEWRDAIENDDPLAQEFHAAWIDLVLRQGLEWDEDGAGDVLKPRSALPDTLQHAVPEHSVVLTPDFAVVNPQKGDSPLMLVTVYSADTALDQPLKGDKWAASPAERMVELCRALDVRLGLVTNGEQWTFVDAPIGAVTTFASWYARLWGQEPKTLQAFVNLLGIRRFFVDRDGQLPALLDESLKLQDEVTDALGEQVSRAVEVLIQALDRADVDRNRELLEGIRPAELYEAGLTVMMRIVFLLSAEERGLLLLGDERYEANYSVSTLRMQLRGESEEILERRWDAWSRLLAIFRAVYGGIEHEALRLPALGGSLFDPDRFPFLEGRRPGSNWKEELAVPLPIDNRTVLLLLDAVQLFQGRTLSYRALDVEQIGYVYEGLLEKTVKRADEVTLDLDSTKSAKTPWVTLKELDEVGSKNDKAVQDLLKDRTGSSPSRIKNDLAREVDAAAADKLLTACQGDQALRDRVKPYFHLLRMDRWGYPLVYPKTTFMVTTGTDRRETGTHYTPKSLTEAIVRETLEPVVYVGSAEGKPRDEWKLKSPAELLDLRICDPAMGSGAFLVQVCRWLSERLVESWAEAEAAGNAVTSEGYVVSKQNGYEPLRSDPEERLLAARRLIGERCLYGVDANHLAVELAKLSIWLVTLAKSRPFGFLDHNLRCGDSLLGIDDLNQLRYLEMSPSKGSSRKLFASKVVDEAVQAAVELRTELRARPIRDIRDIEVMAGLDEKARNKLMLPELIADTLVAEVVASEGKKVDYTALSIEIGTALEKGEDGLSRLKRRSETNLSMQGELQHASRSPFHWPLEFPEVFSREDPGFDAFVGNPPFLGGKRISSALGKAYEKYLKRVLTDKKGAADLCAYFFLRANTLCREHGCFGFLATNTISQTDTREIGLATITKLSDIYSTNPSIPWPGSANVTVSTVFTFRGDWNGKRYINGREVARINDYLTDREPMPDAETLPSNKKLYFGTKGTYVHGKGFLISEDEARRYIDSDPRNADIVRPYLVAKDFTTNPRHKPGRWVIDFGNRSEAEASAYKELFEHLVDTVKPHREQITGQIHEECFWKFWDKRAELYSRIKNMDHVIVCPEVSKYSVFALVENEYCFSSMVNVIASDSHAVLAALQSTVHGIWAWSQGSTMKRDLRYTTSDCLDTFPFPLGIDKLLSVGKEFHAKRQAVMTAREEGLTKTYNRIHDPACNDSDIRELRDFLVAMDKEVMTVYEWSDVGLGHDFLDTELGPRFTVPTDVAEEILYRLLKLNGERAKKESEHVLDSAGSARATGNNDYGTVEPDLFTQQISQEGKAR